MPVPRWTRWAAVAVLAAFAIFDLCGRRRAVPIPAASSLAATAGDVPVVDFEVLAAGIRPFPEPGVAAAFAPVPDAVRALDGRRVAVAGYMLPTELTGDRARRFLLCRYPGGCCFSGSMEPDDLVDCTVADPLGADLVSHVPVLAVGRLRVRDVTTGADLAAGLYELEGVDVRRVE